MLYETNEINALVLAGGINRITLFDGYKPGYKAVLPFCGKPLIEYTLAALKRSPEVKKICIVGPVEELKRTITSTDAVSYEFVNCGKTLIENVCRGLMHFRESPIVLVIPSDLPLATSEAISAFLALCSCINTTYQANIFWSMVPEQDFTARYTRVKKGFNRFKDLSICHGNLLLMTPSLLNNSRFITRIDHIYQARKSSIRAAAAVGPGIGLTYLFGVHLFRRLTLSRFAQLASADFHVGLIPVLLHYPEIAVDIDEARDYRFVMEELNKRKQPEAGVTFQES